jgi:phosphoribosyl-ATP pyrophosphohydrolase/phosphoribosyl-AMP cyclohydrolase
MKPDFAKGGGLVPAIVQDARNKDVLMLGYMNEEALRATHEKKQVTFYSRSKERLWTKGESSGNYLKFVSARLDCDRDTLLIQAIPTGHVCHTGTDTCFGDRLPKGFLYELETIVEARKDKSAEESYTFSLFTKGLNKMAQKLGEEAVEVIIEAKENDLEAFENEVADLLFHLIVLLRAPGVAGPRRRLFRAHRR